MNQLLQCPKCSRHKWICEESEILMCLPPILVARYRCANCNEIITTEERDDRILKPQFVVITEGVDVFHE